MLYDIEWLSSPPHHHQQFNTVFFRNFWLLFFFGVQISAPKCILSNLTAQILLFTADFHHNWACFWDTNTNSGVRANELENLTKKITGSVAHCTETGPA